MGPPAPRGPTGGSGRIPAEAGGRRSGISGFCRISWECAGPGYSYLRWGFSCWGSEIFRVITHQDRDSRAWGPSYSGAGARVLAHRDGHSRAWGGPGSSLRLGDRDSGGCCGPGRVQVIAHLDGDLRRMLRSGSGPGYSYLRWGFSCLGTWAWGAGLGELGWAEGAQLGI